MTKCDICKKQIKMRFDGLVWYNMKMPETHLCRAHHSKWMRFHKPYINKHKKVRPIGKAWDKMCDEEARLFMDWFKARVKELRSGEK